MYYSSLNTIQCSHSIWFLRTLDSQNSASSNGVVGCFKPALPLRTTLIETYDVVNMQPVSTYENSKFPVI